MHDSLAPNRQTLVKKTCIVYIAFNRMCSEHKNGGNSYKKKEELVIGHDIYWQILNMRWEPVYIHE